MITEYPNTLIVPGDPGGNPTQNADGAFIKQTPVAPVGYECRYEPSSQGKQFPTADGNFVLSKGIFYLPASTPFIALGTMVEVPGYFKSVVLETYKGELHCKITV